MLLATAVSSQLDGASTSLRPAPGVYGGHNARPHACTVLRRTQLVCLAIEGVVNVLERLEGEDVPALARVVVAAFALRVVRRLVVTQRAVPVPACPRST